MATIYPSGTLYVNGTPIAEVTNTEVVSQRQADPPRHKPTRVVKWQRWRDSRGVMFTAVEYTGQGDKWKLRRDGQDGEWFGINMLERDGWVFCGYAKPDKVEVGQRWHQTGFGVRVVAALECGDKLAKFRDGGAQLCRMITDNTMMEYLGMAESADRAKMHIGVDFAHGPDMTVRSVVTRDQLRAMDERHIQSRREHGRRVGIPTAEQARKDARRANEEAAKRLIANPPKWAYPKAWMCAVLWCMEQRGDRSALLDSLDEGAAWMFIGLYQRLRGEGMTHESALDKATKREVPIVRDIVNAYARGMERQVPRMGRSGVKGGISTCDLGVDYE